MNILLVTKTRVEIVRAHKPRSVAAYLENDGFFSGWRQGFLDAGCQVHIFPHNTFCLPADFAYRFLFAYRALRFIFKKTRLFSLDNYLLNHRIARVIRHYHIDLVLTETNDFLHPDILKKVSGRKVKCVQWFGIYPEMVDAKTTHLFNQYDYILTPCDLGDALLPYINKSRIMFMPVAYAPNIYFNDKDSDYAYDIVFIGGIGSSHSDRLKFLEAVAEKYEKVAYWGAGFDALPEASAARKKYLGYASSQLIRKAYSNAKIALNLTLNNYERVKRGINERTVVIPACRGALQLVIRVDGVKEFFVENKEIACFKDVPELLKKIDFYLSNEQKHKEMVEQAFYKNVGNTYQERARYLLTVIGQ